MTKRTGVAVACAAGVLAVAVVAWRPWAAHPAAERPSAEPAANAAANAAAGLPGKGAGAVPAPTARVSETGRVAVSRDGTNRLVWVDGRWLHPEDSAIVTTALDAALDDDDADKILAEAARLKQHADPEVRSRVAFALSWLGMRGLPDLTSMLTDPDPDVAAEVLDHWKSSLSEIESEPDKAALLGAAAEVLGSDMSDEMLFDLVMECSMLENEYALPQLVTLLGSVTKPEQKQEVIDALHTAMEHENPSDNEEVLRQQALEEAANLARENQAAQPAAPGEGMPPAQPVQGLPGLSRRNH
ncbi:MAG TPA: HEAT repeat domain-containing protein [Kiritimatiellia bacterium]|nr:HEAT repeat domain-containing protein [Kiritimatiellia bacterium]